MERKMAGKEGMWSRMLFTKGTQNLLQKVCPERALTLSLESGESGEPESSWNHRQIRNTHPLLARKKPGWISVLVFLQCLKAQPKIIFKQMFQPENGFNITLAKLPFCGVNLSLKKPPQKSRCLTGRNRRWAAHGLNNFFHS